MVGDEKMSVYDSLQRRHLREPHARIRFIGDEASKSTCI
jgi:hypothetical protein